MGYAEYSIYLLREEKEYYQRSYDITKQKAYYIAGLKQLSVDEGKTDCTTQINTLNNLITDYFYLRMAQKFEHEHYF